MREWAANSGKAAGMAYAEAFRVMKLVPDEPATPEPSEGGAVHE